MSTDSLEKSIPIWKLAILKALAWIPLKLLGPLVGLESKNIPKTGGVLILSNHRSDFDVIALQFCCPRHIRFMAKSELFEMKVINAGVRLFRAFPVHRDSSDRAALKKAIDLLNDGQIVGVFPEGETSESGEPLPLKPGISLIAKASEVPIICVGLKNTAKILPYGKLLPRPAFRSVQVKFGTPIYFRNFETSAEFLEFVAQELIRLSN